MHLFRFLQALLRPFGKLLFIHDAEKIRAVKGGLSPAVDAEPKTPAPAPQKELTLEEVRAVLGEKSRAGFTTEIQVLLKKYGAPKLSGIDPKHYEALLKDVEVLKDAP